MREASRASLGLTLVVGLTLVAGCGGGSQEERPAVRGTPPPPNAAAPDAAVATVAGRTITQGELEAHVRPRLIEIDGERYDALREGLDELIADELIAQEAKKRGMSTEALEEAEVTAKIPEPPDADVKKVYDENKDRFPGQTLEQLKPQIVEYLKGQKADDRRTAFIDELKGRYKTTVALRPPIVEVETAGRPERGGGAKAPITIVEFSDYECPFCGRAEEVVERVMSTYGDKVRLVYRDYPLEMHPHARPASEAANCAHAQGKFWDYHAKLFKNQRELGEDKLKTYADQVGLDRTKFDECLRTKPYQAAIDKDLADGAKVGVNGTPAFFINGRMLSGAQPFEKFKEVIEEELASAKG
jgi:protein-disulfide isomerase